MKKILVTGATGLLGSSLLPFLEDCGFQVVGLGFNSESGDKADLTNKQNVFEKFNLVQPDVVINLAALTNVDTCEEQPELAFSLNVKLVENISEWIQKNSSIHLIHLSTDQIYNSFQINKEEDACPINVYGLTKYASEKIAESVDATVLRTNFIGKSKAGSRQSFTDWLFNNLKSGSSFSLVTDVFFSPVSIETFCRAILKVIEMPKRGIYNLGTREGLSKAEFAKVFAASLGFKLDNARFCRINDLALKARRPNGMIMDSSRFEQAFMFNMSKLSDEISGLSDSYLKN